eukprot:3112620-Amphidinium_carterae.1
MSSNVCSHALAASGREVNAALYAMGNLFIHAFASVTFQFLSMMCARLGDMEVDWISSTDAGRA